MQTHVVLRAGLLEFLACFGGKEHESIVRIDATAVHIYVALGLIGLMPGHPPTWDPDTDVSRPPAGDLVDLRFVWEHDGQTHTADAYDWLREVEYARRPIGRPWVFAGSLRTPDGGLAADVSGVGAAVVDFSDSLICLSRRFSSRNAELWAAANTDALPPLGTPVRLLIRPAAPQRYRVRVDYCGVVWVNGCYCPLEELADLIDLARRQDPQYRQLIRVCGALGSDVARVQWSLAESGIRPDAYRFVPARRSIWAAPARLRMLSLATPP